MVAEGGKELSANQNVQEFWRDSSPHTEGFVHVNGVRLHYLEWSKVGPTLIFIHGLGDNPHVFDDIAGAFVDRFRVIAYARRYHGQSDHKGPLDEITLLEDLRCLMDDLGVDVADLAGWSMGGNEITAMAATYPQRVRRLIYLDGGYDYSDPDFKAAIEALPSTLLETPDSALSSLDAYLLFQQTVEYVALDDMRRIEAYLRENVKIQPNGSIRLRMGVDLIGRLFSSLFASRPRDYARVRSPVLAIYASSGYEPNVSNSWRRDQSAIWEHLYMSPFREKSKARIRKEISNVKVVCVSGTHNGFTLTSKGRVVELMREFLGCEIPAIER